MYLNANCANILWVITATNKAKKKKHTREEKYNILTSIQCGIYEFVFVFVFFSLFFGDFFWQMKISAHLQFFFVCIVYKTHTHVHINVH